MEVCLVIGSWSRLCVFEFSVIKCGRSEVFIFYKS